MGPRSGRWARKASQRTEPPMRVAQSVAEILSKHVVLEVEGIDRMYLNVYVPRLQIVEGVLGFLKKHLGHKVASTRLVEPLTRAFVAAIEKFVHDNAIPMICNLL
jgi:hypothetical protein